MITFQVFFNFSIDFPDQKNYSVLKSILKS